MSVTSEVHDKSANWTVSIEKASHASFNFFPLSVSLKVKIPINDNDIHLMVLLLFQSQLFNFVSRVKETRNMQYLYKSRKAAEISYPDQNH